MVKRLTNYQRERIVRLKYGERLSNARIKEIISDEENVVVSEKSIYNLAKKYDKYGIVDDLSRTGRPQKLSWPEINLINNAVTKDKEITLKRLKDQINMNVSISTIFRRLVDNGWSSTTTRYCQVVSEKNKICRFNYGILSRIFLEDLKNCIFTDESTIQIRYNRVKRWRKEDENQEKVPKPKHPLTVHVWAGISYKGATDIQIFEGIMDSNGYQRILENCLMPFLENEYPYCHRLIMDNCKTHVSESTICFLLKNKIKHYKTPAESPDLNPIESVWSHLKTYLRNEAKPYTKDELVNGIKQFWKKTITPEYCINYIEHIKQRVLPRLISMKGRATGF